MARDADGDLLLDLYETETGTFLSPSDTGTDPFDPDSDGDGFLDGWEVQSGTDPNDPLDVPAPPVPLDAGWLLSMLLAMTGCADFLHRRRRGEPPRPARPRLARRADP
jgi:hypothetical protein